MTQPELDCSVHTDTQLLFDESLRTHLRPSAPAAEFYADSITPDSDHFKDSNLLSPDSGDAEVILSLVTTFSMPTSCCLVAVF